MDSKQNWGSIVRNKGGMIQPTITHRHHSSIHTGTLSEMFVPMGNIHFPKRDQPKAQLLDPFSWLGSSRWCASPLFQISYGSLVYCPPQPHLSSTTTRKNTCQGFSTLEYTTRWCKFDALFQGPHFPSIAFLVPSILPPPSGLLYYQFGFLVINNSDGFWFSEFY